MTIIAEEILTIEHQGPAQLIGFGIPFPKGTLPAVENLTLFLNEKPLAFSAKTRNQWPDGSVRWCWCRAVIHEGGTLSAKSAKAHEHHQESPQDSDQTEKFSNRKPSSFSLLKLDPNHQQANHHHDLFRFSINDSKPHIVSISSFLSVNQKAFPFVIEKTTTETTDFETVQSIHGIFKLGEQALNLHANLFLCDQTEELNIMLRLHNPSPAHHTSGRWDLGDEGSFHIDHFGLDFEIQDSLPGLLIRDHQTDGSKDQNSEGFVGEGAGLKLKQHGSGGEAWQSPIHWDANQESTVQSQGFELCSDEGETKFRGLRAEPLGWLTLPKRSIAIAPLLFWQNFPAEINTLPGKIRFSLFPDNTELQGGESKTWFLKGRLNQGQPDANTLEGLYQPGQCLYHQGYLDQCKVFPHISFQPTTSPLSQLIQTQALTGESNFFQKRERVDVYGWRHFGELYADHETSLTDTPDQFISHYNNQYDPVMGMTLQYLITQQQEWLHLLKPLAQHVIDIDIYDTQSDRAEYNGGLFWHTDHYLPALTSTHRSYSKDHTAAYEGYAGGGGPGGQHCYTTGLALQYWLFGNEQAKDRVHQLCHWVGCFYNGSGGLLDRTLRLLTIDMKPNQLTNIGIKRAGYRYPLDRGTGNYITALLDSIELSGQWSELGQVGSIIRQTVHPRENLAERELLDVENAWFYTVFLQSVARFLFLKESLDQIDADYWYARHSFMHYLDWMLNHEKFYLSQPDQLEFPNDTWVAQDIRKANLFYWGWYFAEQTEPKFLEQATSFFQYIEETLSASKEKHYTRILAILMQNAGVREKLLNLPLNASRSAVPWKSPQYSIKATSNNPLPAVAIYMKDMCQLLKKFSLKREIQWLKIRFGKL